MKQQADNAKVQEGYGVREAAWAAVLAQGTGNAAGEAAIACHNVSAAVAAYAHPRRQYTPPSAAAR